MNKKIRKEAMDHLFDAILCLKDREECYTFFEDVCTVNELFSIAQRFEVAHMLREQKTYLEIAEKQYKDIKYAGYYNVGPDDCDCMTTGELVSLFCKYWGGDVSWENQAEINAPHEADFLKLDCSRLKSVFGWKPRWHMDQCMEKTCEFSKVWMAGGDIPAEMDKEIDEFLKC